MRSKTEGKKGEGTRRKTKLQQRIPSAIKLVENAILTSVDLRKPSLFENAVEVAAFPCQDSGSFPIYVKPRLSYVVGNLRGLRPGPDSSLMLLDLDPLT